MVTGLSRVVIGLADAIGVAESLEDIYQAALIGLRDVTGIDRASILLFDPDGVMRLKASAGLSDDYRRAVEGHTPWAPGDPTPPPVVVADVYSDAALAAFRAAFEREGIRALAFIPVVARRRVIGKFMLYSGETNAFDRGELPAALAIGYQIGFAVERKRAERSVQQALEQEATLRERLDRLTDGAERLLTSLTAETVLDEVLTLAQSVITADGYAVWRRNGDEWRVVAQRGLGAAFTGQHVQAQPQTTFDDPVIAEDVTAMPLLENRREPYRREGIASLMSIPLHIGNAQTGSIVFYYRATRRPTDLELRVATTLGHLAAAAISNGELHTSQQRLRQAAEDAQLRSAFLADASDLLGSLDYQRNLRRVAELAVPRLSDWCAVDLLSDEGRIERLVVTHQDPERIAYAHALHRKYPPRLDDPSGVGYVLRTGSAQLFPEITDELLVASAVDDEHLRIARELRLRSAMVVPLTANRRTFGAITFVTAIGGRRFTDADLDFALELGRRAALAIDNARLYEQARDANRLKDEFLATLSHELRTPLNVILGRTRRLIDDPSDAAAVRQQAETIERNAQSLARLVEDLLDVSRFSVGQVALALARLDLRPIVQTVVGSLELMARSKRVAVRLTIGDHVPDVMCDATRVQQVIWNLVSNAIKFTADGGEVAIAIGGSDTNIVVTVTDTGIGIAPEFLPHVFEMFRQAEPANNGHHGGLGLGLSIVRRLVELHGGTVKADSGGLGSGATFTVTLPAADAAAVTL